MPTAWLIKRRQQYIFLRAASRNCRVVHNHEEDHIRALSLLFSFLKKRPKLCLVCINRELSTGQTLIVLSCRNVDTDYGGFINCWSLIWFLSQICMFRWFTYTYLYRTRNWGLMVPGLQNLKYPNSARIENVPFWIFFSSSVYTTPCKKKKQLKFNDTTSIL